MIRRSAAWVVGTVAVAGALALLGYLVPASTPFAVAGAAAVLVVGLTAYDQAALPVLAMPALVVVQRVAGGGVDLTLSDLAAFAAFWASLVLAPRPYSAAMRSLLWLTFFYQVTTLFTVIANPYLANTVEWFHAWLSTGGALVVGWAVGRSGRARVGLTLFMIPCLLIALLTCVAWAQNLAAGYDGPVYLTWPFGMHKNLIGCVLGIAALVAYARPWWVGWPRWFTYASFALCTVGVAASEARQALVGLAVGVMLITLRTDPDRKRSKLILLAAIPAIWFVWLAVQDQLSSDNPFNSANQRLTWYQQALEVWRSSPWFGVGLRWWTAGRTEYTFQPPNAELEVLSSAGAVGLLGFLVLFAGSVVVLWRMNPRFGTLALTVLLSRFVQGQFDLFWSAIVVTVPFAIAGVCVGAEAYARSREAYRSGLVPDDPDRTLPSVQEMETARR
ncbi:O-antigen ligase family protein [Cellulosimicrobium marinum]|uniref:O-antigen ligase family protein n=1 Tax=Cellulosimicrobium marinum TaxID=1638992 RepID=UPI001E2BA70F|nr:O-antigen ligase family protein [Cellulosimicrobium marinum]MCB7137029.1 O-antigen ligase family protein [Cellulosimicrobium marinum]